MSAVLAEDPGDVEIILAATARQTLDEAIAWLAEDYPMSPATRWPKLLQALVTLGPNGDEEYHRALRRVTREATASRFDTGRVLFESSKIPSPERFKAALDELVARSKNGTLAGLDARGLMLAQRKDSRGVETLCYAVGVAYGDAKKWFSSGGAWKEEECQELLGYLDELVEGRSEPAPPNTEPAQALELREGQGWGRIDAMRVSGVPYEILLAQRAVGGVWLQHKNETSARLSVPVADMVCEELEERGLDYRRATTSGGDDRQKDLQKICGVHDKRVGLVVTDANGRATFGLVFSTANDGGTARASGDGLVRIPLGNLPFAILLSGKGWAGRPETDGLALHFGGRLFTEQTIDDLVDCIEMTVR